MYTLHAQAMVVLVVISFAITAVTACSANVAFDARSSGSGHWSDSATWADGRAPKPGDRVQVRSGHTVVYDAASDDPIRMIHVAGVLTFSRDKSTRLAVGLIKVQRGDHADEEGFDCTAHGESRSTAATTTTASSTALSPTIT